MNESQLQKKIAKLESINDQLQAEYSHLDDLLKSLGFEKGIATLKQAATEMLSKQKKKDTKEG